VEAEDVAFVAIQGGDLGEILCVLCVQEERQVGNDNWATTIA
jgi:hypothetical protein